MGAFSCILGNCTGAGTIADEESAGVAISSIAGMLLNTCSIDLNISDELFWLLFGAKEELTGIELGFEIVGSLERLKLPKTSSKEGIELIASS